jgi:putative transposase
MVHYRRYLSDNPDEVFFLTLVTRNRNPCLRDKKTINKIHTITIDSFNYCKGEIIAYVYLPDHLHLLVKQGTRSYSNTIKRIKLHVNQKLLNGDGTIWQPRFWEHKIWDDQDFEKHADYIHFNPVKHGLAKSPVDWPYSSFHDFVKSGVYPEDWSDGGNLEIHGSEFD